MSEQARKLVNEFEILMPPKLSPMVTCGDRVFVKEVYKNAYIENAKKCALIAVNRNIKILRDLQKESQSNYWSIEHLILDEQDLRIEIEMLNNE